MPESDGHGGNDSTNAETRVDAAGADVIDDMAALLDEIDATCGLIGEAPSMADDEIHTLSAAVDRLETAVDAPPATGGAGGRAEVADSEMLPEAIAEPDRVDAGEVLPDAEPPPAEKEDPEAREEHALPEAPVAPSAPDSGEPAEEIASPDGLDDAEPDAAPDADAPPRAASTSESTSTLSELDGSLAEDAEDLLNANFDTVSEVLDEVFDEQAAIVQEPAGGVAIVERTVSTDEESEAVAPVDDGSPSAEVETEAEAEAEVVVQEGAHDASLSQVIPDRDEPSALLPDREPVEAPPPEDPEPTDDAPDVVEDPGPESELLPEADLEPEPFVTDLVPAGPIGALWSKIEPAVIGVLTIANAPLRRLPQRVQPYVDWIALSLVFWVPIVWVVAFFVVGN